MCTGRRSSGSSTSASTACTCTTSAATRSGGSRCSASRWCPSWCADRQGGCAASGDHRCEDSVMDAERVHALRDALRHTEWWARASLLGSALRATSGPGHLLLVGTPRIEPWHLAAHLDDEARLSRLPQLAPALVRWSPPPQAPPHLSIGLSRLEHAGRGETVFVVSPDSAPDPLLNRVDDARRTGATIVALDAEEGPLAALAHERMTVSPSGLSLPDALRNVLTPLTQVGTNRGRPPHTALGTGI